MSDMGGETFSVHTAVVRGAEALPVTVEVVPGALRVYAAIAR